MGHDAVEATKTICWTKGEGAVDHSRWLNKFCLSCQNLDLQARSGRLKSVDSEAVFQVLEANLANSI